VSFEHLILELRLESEAQILLLEISKETGFFLYKVPLKDRWNVYSRTMRQNKGSG
jgi:hypothetical protein